MKKQPNIIFLILTAALYIVGVLMIFSASPSLALKLGDSFYYLKRHIFYSILGFFGLYYAFNLDLNKLKKLAPWLLIVSLGLLLALNLPGVGKTMGGATRWMDLYFFSFQPAELAKFSMVLFLAVTLSAKGGGPACRQAGIKDFFKGLFPQLVLVGLISLIIIKQPDMGTALSIAGTSFIMFFVAGARMGHLLFILGIGAAAVLGLSVSSPYRMRRLLAYLDPWSDPLNVGFHIIQSLLAIGSGGLFGLGLGNSRQKFFYLPQQYADFIFAVLCEELGFIGAAGLIVLFLAFFISGIRIASQSKDAFSQLLASGLIAMFAVQTFMNLMVVTGLLPTTGIPLPFISYGGTALIINLFSAGLILNISRGTK
ncbi:putative lipid II flippase FtsW [Candidatus Saganbacteria bacterium]|nr:putative lipid II flippase FtsW [Candidatus Saganbacteria bacterium]